MYLVEVLVEHPVYRLDHTFTYLSNEEVIHGVRVKVSFGNQTLIGYVEKVTKTNQSQKELEDSLGFSLKYILEVLDSQPLLNKELEMVADYLAKTTMSPKIACLLTMLPKHLKPNSSSKKTRKYKRYVQAIPNKEGKTKKQQECYEYIEKTKQPVPYEKIPYSRQIIQKLYESHAIDIIRIEVFEEYKSNVRMVSEWPKLNDQQLQALDKLHHARKEHKTSLLYGVTGSGKTEIYLHLAKEVIEADQSAIMLVPEISLTPMMVNRFKERFGQKVAVLHSRLSTREKYDEYCRIASGKVQIVVGARSAIFAPLNRIGVIILDEEHDASYKQENGVRYHAKDVALYRARYHQCFVVLGSATPSVESYARAQKGIYELVELNQRFNQKQMPEVKIINMSDELHHGNYGMLSRVMEEKIKERIASNEQVILLMNRRGYANYLLCQSCGYVVKCPHCDVTLTYHYDDHSLKCHYCGYEQPVVHICPSCHQRTIKPVGQGIQQVEQYLKQRIEGARVLRMDMDTTKQKDAHEKMLSSFEKQEYNILLGTQMVAKGLDFENVTFVGVIQADIMLNLPDFRASERTFQLLLQVAGRSGRGDKSGEVVIQTYNPDHYAIKACAHHDYKDFYKHEIEYRYLGNYPPYCYMVSLVIRSRDEKLLEDHAHAIAQFIKDNASHSIVLGPAKGMIYKANDYYRYRILVKYTKSKEVYAVLNELHMRYNKSKINVELLIDFNPYNQN